MSTQEQLDSASKKKFARPKRAGRTLFIKGSFNPSDSLSGLKHTEVTPKGNTVLVFDTIEQSFNALKQLKTSGQNVKFNHYQVFFRVGNVQSNHTYDQIKQSIIKKLLETAPNSNVLHFKLYRKNDKFLGSGNFVVDTKESLDSLMSNRNFHAENFEISLFRFKKHPQQQQHSQSASE